MKLVTAVVVNIEILANDVAEYTLRIKGELTVHPGQYILLKVGEQWKPFSVIKTSAKDTIKIVIKHIKDSQVATFFSDINVGSIVNIQGPRGEKIFSATSDAVFVATGTGAVPLLEMAKHSLQEGFNRELYLIFGARNLESAFYADELNELSSKYPNCHAAITLSRADNNWKGYRGYTIDYIRDNFSRFRKANFYVCGRIETVASVFEQLSVLGVTDSKQHLIE